MKNTLLLCAFTCLSFFVQAQKKIVVMGSSTAAGTGANPTDSSWVNRLQFHFRKNMLDNLDTLVINIAGYGQTTYHQMPTGSVPAIAGRPLPDTGTNVTKAASFSPDVVIINLPSNDVANLYWGPGTYSTVETMNNYRTMVTYLTNNTGANVFVTTTQPRNDMNAWPEKPQMLRQLVDSINLNFVSRAIDFWTPLVTPTGNQLRADLAADPIHPNTIGHRLLFQQVAAKNLFVVNSPLPVVLQQFRVEKRSSVNLLQWTSSGETPGTIYRIERSSDGISFSQQASIAAIGNGSQQTYQWTDPQTPGTKAYYRLRIEEGGRTSFSSVVSIDGQDMGWLQKWSLQGHTLRVELISAGAGKLLVYDLNGRLLRQQNFAANATSVQVNLSGLSKGNYILHVESGGAMYKQKFQKLD